MATRSWHYLRAERLLTEARSSISAGSETDEQGSATTSVAPSEHERSMRFIAEAQAHATLAAASREVEVGAEAQASAEGVTSKDARAFKPTFHL
jgi:hypothetical protein